MTGSHVWHFEDPLFLQWVIQYVEVCIIPTDIRLIQYKGKMQGDNYQVDKEPLLNLPIIEPNVEKQTEIAELVSKIIENKQKIIDYNELLKQAKADNNFDREIQLTKELDKLKTENETAENKIDDTVYSLYELSENDIATIENEIK